MSPRKNHPLTFPALAVLASLSVQPTLSLAADQDSPYPMDAVAGHGAMPGSWADYSNQEYLLKWKMRVAEKRESYCTKFRLLDPAECTVDPAASTSTKDGKDNSSPPPPKDGPKDAAKDTAKDTSKDAPKDAQKDASAPPPTAIGAPRLVIRSIRGIGNDLEADVAVGADNRRFPVHASDLLPAPDNREIAAVTANGILLKTGDFIRYYPGGH